LRSASSKSRPPSATTFFAPRPFFFAPRMFFFGAAPAVVLRTAGFAAGIAAGVLPEAPVRGDLGRSVAVPLEPGLRKGEPERGVPVREGGFEGRLMEGLSHDEKKSSSSPAGVLLLLPPNSGTSVTTTSSGYLGASLAPLHHDLLAETYDLASAAQRLVSSYLYLVAALLVYLALWSLLASAAVPPCDWKYLVALSLPPTFMMRS